MRRIVILLILINFTPFIGISQSCLKNVTIYPTQEDIDDFSNQLPNCIYVEGHIVIRGDDITNLNGLSNIQRIAWLTIENTTNLKDLSGLDNINQVDYSLYIGDNKGLTNLNHLSNLTKIDIRSLTIARNDSLLDIDGLNNLNSIGRGLTVVSNKSLRNISGFNNLLSIEQDLIISDNNELTNIDGFANLETVNYDIIISDNAVLENITGLENINSTDVSNIYIGYNASLSVCEVQSICNYVDNPNGDAIVSINNTGCNSTDEIQDACDANNIEEDFNKALLSVYPNPARNKVSIYLKNGNLPDNVKLYNQIGQLIYSKKNTDKSMDIRFLKPGIYVVEVILGEISSRTKLIIY